MSAACISSAGLLPATAHSTMPMLAVTTSSWPAMRTGSDSARNAAFATATTSSLPAQSSTRMTNSSPPIRAASRSVPDAQASSLRPTATSS
jgi:hypothetical protein